MINTWSKPTLVPLNSTDRAEAGTGKRFTEQGHIRTGYTTMVKNGMGSQVAYGEYNRALGLPHS